MVEVVKKNWGKRWIVGLVFVGNLMTIISLIKAQSLFLSEVGAGALPVVMFVNAVLGFSFAIAKYKLPDKLPNSKLISLYLGFCMLGFSVVALLGDMPSIRFPLYFLVAYFARINFAGMLTILGNIFHGPLEAKKLAAKLIMAANLGVLAGPLVYENFEFLRDSGLIGVYDLMMLLVAFLIYGKVRRSYKGAIAKEKEHASKFLGVNQFGEDFKFNFLKSKLSRMMSILVMSLIGLGYFMDFKFNSVLANSMDSRDIEKLLGFYYFAENLIEIVISGLFLNRGVFYLGIKGILLLFPVCVLTLLFFSMINNFNPLVVTGMMIFMVSVNKTFVYTSLAQLYSVSGKFGLFGILVRNGMAVMATQVLLLFMANQEWERIGNTSLIIGLLVLMLYVAVQIGKILPEEIKKMIYGNDQRLKDVAIEFLAEKPQAEKGELLLRKLIRMKSTKDDLKVKILGVLAEIGNPQSIVDVIEHTRTGSSKVKYSGILALQRITKNTNFLKYPLSKHLILEYCEKVLAGDDEMILKNEILNLLKNFELEDVIVTLEREIFRGDEKVEVNVIEVLAAFGDRAMLKYVRPMLESENLEVVRAAIVGLWQFKDLRGELSQKVAWVLGKKDEVSAWEGLYLVGDIGAEWERKYVKKWIKAENDLIRMVALMTEFRIIGKSESFWKRGLKDLIYEFRKLIQGGKGVIKSLSGEQKLAKRIVRELAQSIREQKKSVYGEFLTLYKKLEKRKQKALISEILELRKSDMKRCLWIFDDFEEDVAEIKEDLALA